jgi:hypothetical protein
MFVGLTKILKGIYLLFLGGFLLNDFFVRMMRVLLVLSVPYENLGFGWVLQYPVE